MSRTDTHIATEGELLGLLYELLDAHADTLEFGAEPADELRWSAHLDYLQALQRRTREIMASWSSVAHAVDAQ